MIVAIYIEDSCKLAGKGEKNYMKDQIQDFVQKYQLFQQDEVQKTQLKHRFALVEAFQIEPGMRVLEIGCGQGDTTVVLADAVGETGHVVAIDIADANYGAPFTLGQAHERIAQSALGNRISFHLETDFLSFPIEKPFDVIVLSHCTWYFKSKDVLNQYFKRMQELTNKVCIAEWDLEFPMIEQRSHFCAVTILALFSQFIENDGNIQQVIGRSQLEKLGNDAGFKKVSTQVVDASFLQDGAWETDYANHIRTQFDAAPPAIQALVDTYYDVMNSTTERKSLNSFVVKLEK